MGRRAINRSAIAVVLTALVALGVGARPGGASITRSSGTRPAVAEGGPAAGGATPVVTPEQHDALVRAAKLGRPASLEDAYLIAEVVVPSSPATDAEQQNLKAAWHYVFDYEDSAKAAGAAIESVFADDRGLEIGVASGTLTDAVRESVLKSVNPVVAELASGEVRVVEAQPVASTSNPVYGGDLIASDRHNGTVDYCTKGWAANKNNGNGTFNWYFITAGHCAIYSLAHGSCCLYEHGWPSPHPPTWPFDGQLFSFAGTTFDSVLLFAGSTGCCSPPYGDYTGRTHSANWCCAFLTPTSVGDPGFLQPNVSVLAHDGETSGYHSGTYRGVVAQMSANVKDGNGVNQVVQYFNQYRVDAYTCPGDSGGPMFGIYGVTLNSAALGITTLATTELAQNCGGTSYYTPLLGDLNAYGLTLFGP